ncbi:MAG: hypothetical protein JWR21_1702 [Herminiimonas sp.]|nr:hypothetical protein [Herminiimonas sp.]MDB5853631.1 hypothetical protein [Herminiimonas sp.]
MTHATFRFYAELNDFLPRDRRQKECSVNCARDATVKHMIEALGVPHTEVELVMVNGESVGFERRIADGDRIAVYPLCESLDVTPILRVREQALRDTRFVADAHLGGLARLLRIAGFDTRFENTAGDNDIVALSRDEHRIVLTRDVELLKRRELTHGCYVRAIKPVEQFQEIVARLDLASCFHPFSLCLECNAPLVGIDKASVVARVPPMAYACHEHFSTCEGCHRVYWEGTHWRRMREMLDSISAHTKAAPSAHA